MNATYLKITRGTSRGRDTYGYNIVTLTDVSTGKRYRCMGGGYDMLGTVLGDWLEDAHRSDLLAIQDRAASSWIDGTRTANDSPDCLYGMSVTFTPKMTRVTLNGACGVESVLRIAKAAGVEVLTRTHDSRGNTTGYMVQA